MNYIKDVPLYNNDGTVNVVVEIVEGSTDKNELIPPYFNKLECVRTIELDYPFYYGSFPQTYAGDKDPLDMVLFTNKPHKLLDLVKVDVIGAVKTIDAGEQDDKIICVESDCSLINVKKQMKKAMEFLKKYKGKNADMKIEKKLATMDEAAKLVENAHSEWKKLGTVKVSTSTKNNVKNNVTVSTVASVGNKSKNYSNGRIRIVKG